MMLPVLLLELPELLELFPPRIAPRMPATVAAELAVASVLLAVDAVTEEEAVVAADVEVVAAAVEVDADFFEEDFEEDFDVDLEDFLVLFFVVFFTGINSELEAFSTASFMAASSACKHEGSEKKYLFHFYFLLICFNLISYIIRFSDNNHSFYQ